MTGAARTAAVSKTAAVSRTDVAVSKTAAVSRTDVAASRMTAVSRTIAAVSVLSRQHISAVKPMATASDSWNQSIKKPRVSAGLHISSLIINQYLIFFFPSLLLYLFFFTRKIEVFRI